MKGRAIFIIKDSWEGRRRCKSSVTKDQLLINRAILTEEKV